MKAIEELIASVECTRASVRNLKQIKSMADTLSSGFIGWSAIHSFRCNTRGGSKTIGNYLFIFDKSFKTILNVFDANDEDLGAAIDKIGTAQAMTDEQFTELEEQYTGTITKLQAGLAKIR